MKNADYENVIKIDFMTTLTKEFLFKEKTISLSCLNDKYTRQRIDAF